VDVVPVMDEGEIEITIPDDDLRVDVYRSSGPGGQGVNTTDSAVRLTHLPTGIVVSCQNERSQLQNKATAMALLRSKLAELEREKREAELAAVRGEQRQVTWGSQIRSYVLHPYQMVKDLRTGAETGNTSAVLDGDLDAFMTAFLQWRARGAAAAGDGV
jgi:peptide chain release factor 2